MIYIKDPVNATEAMLRELVPPPRHDEFDLSICPLGAPHGFRLDIGDVIAHRIASWALHCNGSFYGLGRCASQLGKELDLAESKKLRRLIQEYTPRAKAVDKAYEAIGELELSFAAVVELWREQDPCPAFPTNAADKMGLTGTKLNHIRRVIETLNPADVPDAPDVLNRAVLDPKGKGKEVYVEIRASSETSDYPTSDSGDVLDEDALELVMPSTGLLLYVIIYVQSGNPYHTKFWVQNPAFFDFTKYAFKHCTLDPTFLLYSATTDTYEPAAGPVNLAGRGEYMILRKGTINRIDCCGLLRWEQRARQSARDSAETDAGSTQPVAAVSPSLNTAAEEHPELESATQPRPSRASKRSATPEEEATTSSKKQKTDMQPVIATTKLTKKQVLAARLQKIKDHGGHGQPPLSISTSEPDYSSDIEILD
ncbi:hypothetical protein B0H13DRAFT_1902258 [Mycena leptocephala]|nr:hypothetical protein B0H13DRAFT_1902258 [Mycena leptocephala]